MESIFDSIGPVAMETFKAFEGQPRFTSRIRSRSPRPRSSRFHSVGPGVMEAFEGQPSMRADRMNRSRAAKKIQTKQRKRRKTKREKAARTIQRILRRKKPRKNSSSLSSSSRRKSRPPSTRRSRPSSTHRSRPSSSPRSASNAGRSSLSRSNASRKPLQRTQSQSRKQRQELYRAQLELNRLKLLKKLRDKERNKPTLQPPPRPRPIRQMYTMSGQPMFDIYGRTQYYENDQFIPPSSRLLRQNAVSYNGKSANNFYKHSRIG